MAKPEEVTSVLREDLTLTSSVSVNARCILLPEQLKGCKRYVN